VPAGKQVPFDPSGVYPPEFVFTIKSNRSEIQWIIYTVDFRGYRCKQLDFFVKTQICIFLGDCDNQFDKSNRTAIGFTVAFMNFNSGVCRVVSIIHRA
jgi:hypothetical protein